MPQITLDDNSTQTIHLEPNDPRRLALLCGQFDEHLRQIEKRLHIDIRNRGHRFTLTGSASNVMQGGNLLTDIYRETAELKELAPDDIHLFLQQLDIKLPMTEPAIQKDAVAEHAVQPMAVIKTKRGVIKPRGKSQQQYVKAIQSHDINFGIGPAGTGKTFLAVACAVQALLRDEIERIILVRPAVEAGEKLGFLPGDLSQKVDPYLRPLYDALNEMLGPDTVIKLLERNIIEIAPLAYMRGRTLSNAFIILDESQNTTREQMKMFLTRVGFGSTAVITGDMSQIDLPRGVHSGLRQACEILGDVEDIHFSYFTSSDVMRHPVVQRIIDAYDAHDAQSTNQNPYSRGN